MRSRVRSTRGHAAKDMGSFLTALLSRAVHLDLATDYSTDSFLLVLRRFISLRGCPVTMWSDRGSQLKAADKDLREIITGLDEKAIVSFGAENSFDWKFCSPDAPWQNGCAEALIKSVKKSLKIAIGSQVFSFSEMQTVLTETSNLVNERPIGRHPTSVEDGSYLSPNDLLLGRSNNRVPNDTFDVTTSHRKRYAFVQRVVSSFWKRWTEDFFPSLIVCQSWRCCNSTGCQPNSGKMEIRASDLRRSKLERWLCSECRTSIQEPKFTIIYHNYPSNTESSSSNSNR